VSPSERATLMACRLAREVSDGDVVGVGLGTPLGLAAALAARRSHAPGADVVVAGAVSPDADVADCLAGAGSLAGCTAGFAPHLLTMEWAERQAMTVQFLRPAEVDGEGNLNVSRIVQEGRLARRLPGGLAVADVARIMPRLVVYHPDHRRRSLVAGVSFVTGRGGGDQARGTLGTTLVVTNRAVLALGPEGARLESVHPGEDVGAVLADTGFEATANGVGETEPPSSGELAALDAVDRLRLRELDLRETRAGAAERLSAHQERSDHA
jgi:acyl CoA:acetate/3-ketoacid CoA transferase beta subunit